MSAVTLSQAVRTNLLSLQNTASLLDTTQTRLATGNKVNSALDNPTSYFTAASLNSRAGDLGNLLDSVSNAVQTIQAANDGITSITKLVESAQATAGQAQQLSATLGGAGVTATASTSTSTSLTISSGAQAAVITGTAFTTLDLSGPGDHYDIAVNIDGGGYQVANLNAPGQVVLSGARRAIAAARERALAAGARRAIPLAVSGPFHSVYMRRPAQEFERFVSSISINEPRVPIVLNTTARPTREVAVLRGELSKQIERPVLWEDSLRSLFSMGCGVFVELGPGSVLAGLVRRTLPEATTIAAGSPETIRTVADQFRPAHRQPGNESGS
jgi:hypothetical protein